MLLIEIWQNQEFSKNTIISLIMLHQRHPTQWLTTRKTIQNYHNQFYLFVVQSAHIFPTLTGCEQLTDSDLHLWWSADVCSLFHFILIIWLERGEKEHQSAMWLGCPATDGKKLSNFVLLLLHFLKYHSASCWTTGWVQRRVSCMCVREQNQHFKFKMSCNVSNDHCLLISADTQTCLYNCIIIINEIYR